MNKNTCDHGLTPGLHHCALCMHEGKGARPSADVPIEDAIKSEMQYLRRQLKAAEDWQAAHSGKLDELRQQLAESLQARETEVAKRDELLTKYEALQEQLAESEGLCRVITNQRNGLESIITDLTAQLDQHEAADKTHLEWCKALQECAELLDMLPGDRITDVPKVLKAQVAQYQQAEPVAKVDYHCDNNLRWVGNFAQSLVTLPSGTKLYTTPWPSAPVADLHPATADLVARFSRALAEKLAAAEKKYGYSDGWKGDHWLDECRAKLLEHVIKGDPRDVAAYCAFLWHHGSHTAAAAPVAVVLPEHREAIGVNGWAETIRSLAIEEVRRLNAVTVTVAELVKAEEIAVRYARARELFHDRKRLLDAFASLPADFTRFEFDQILDKMRDTELRENAIQASQNQGE